MKIITTLTDQRKGKFLIEASEALADVVKACRATGKKGSVTIKLKIKPTDQEIMVMDEIKTEIPKPDAAASVFYDDEEGNLSREDPNQGNLPFEIAQAK